MSLYSEENFIGKLCQLQDAQDSIPLVSHWMIYHRRHAKENVRTWYNELLKAPSKRKLVFIYLCNDVCQNSRKKGKEFIDAFRSIIKDAIVHSYRHSIQDIQKKIRRVLKVWGERKVFDSEVLGSIEKALDETDENDGTPEMEATKGHLSSLTVLSSTTTEAPPLISTKPLTVEPSPSIPAKRGGAYDEDCRDPRLKSRKSEGLEHDTSNETERAVAGFYNLSTLPEQLQTLYHLAMKAYQPTSKACNTEIIAMQGSPNLAAVELSTNSEDIFVKEMSQQQLYISCLKDLVSLEEDRLLHMKERNEARSQLQDSNSNHSVKDHLQLDIDNPSFFDDTCLQVNAIYSDNATSIPETPIGPFEPYDSDAVDYVGDKTTSTSTMDSSIWEEKAFSLDASALESVMAALAAAGSAI